jgi:hypothetical protein
MPTELPHDADRDRLRKQYGRYRDVLADIIGELGDAIGPNRAKTVIRTLGLSSDLPSLIRSDRLRSSLYAYLMFTDRRKGRTLLERMELQLRHRVEGVPGGVGVRVLDALVASEYRILDITQVVSDLGVTARDALAGQSLFIMDGELSRSWEAGTQFGGRVVEMPEFALLAGEPIETDVQPGEDFGEGSLNTHDQARLEAALLQAFAEAVQEC